MAQAYANHVPAPESALQAIGQALWQALQIDEAAFAAARTHAGAAVLPLILHCSAPAVHSLPWECLHHPTLGFLAKHPAFTFSRRLLAADAPSARSLARGPLRVVLFSSMPEAGHEGVSRLKVEEEQARVQAALMPWIGKGLLHLEIPEDGRFASLQSVIKDFQPHVLFLSGHGSFQHAPASDEAHGVFYFEDEYGAPDPVRDQALAQAMIGSGVQAVVLSACESAKALASSDLAQGLAQCLSAQGVPFVIGMREAVLDDAGIPFAHTLCDAIARGERIDLAVQSARSAMQQLAPDARHLAADSPGQWCLPVLLSRDAGHALIDWHFQPQPAAYQIQLSQHVGEVRLPERFIGRRNEMRQFKQRLFTGKIKNLLLTGPGGQGKTSFAGKLAQEMAARGWQVFAFSARSGNTWHEFLFESLQMALDSEANEKYSRYCFGVQDEGKRAQKFFALLQTQSDKPVLLLFDNLESLQDADSHQITDAQLAAWLHAACAAPGVAVLATSRWNLPGWTGQHHALNKANYGDFLQLALRAGLPAHFLQPAQLSRVYQTLFGNSRGLEFFAKALQGMGGLREEEAFLAKLAASKEELQTDMALASILGRLPAPAYQLLRRVPVYATPVPEEGVFVLAQDLPDAPTALQALLDVSLLEVSFAPEWQAVEYQCSPLVTDWLQARGELDDDMRHAQTAADYQVYLFDHERQTLEQAITVHHALRRAERHEEANRLTLDEIVGRKTFAGAYIALLHDWLPYICGTEDLKIKGEAFGQMGKLYLAVGDLDSSFIHLMKSLELRRKIGDAAGESFVLNNLAALYCRKCDYESARKYYFQSLEIAVNLNDRIAQGLILNNVSQIYKTQGMFDEAMNFLESALLISRESGNEEGEGCALNNISQILKHRGDVDAALEYVKGALKIFNKIGKVEGQAAALHNISEIHSVRGEYQSALSCLRCVLDMQRRMGDKIGESAALNGIGNIYYVKGDFNVALSFFEEALEINLMVGDKRSISANINNVSQVYRDLGFNDVAMLKLLESLNILESIGEKESMGDVLNNIALIHNEEGRYEDALMYFKRALEFSMEYGDELCCAVTLNNISSVCKERGDLSQALECLGQALKICEKIGAKREMALVLCNTYDAYKRMGECDVAIDYLIKGCDIQRNIGDFPGFCISLYNAGHFYAEKKQLKESFSAWLLAYRIAKKINMGKILEKLSELATHLGLKPGINDWEALSQQFPETEASHE
ncbi:tetratricopeptide repeat protein [Massilia sp. W12]|uniref:tetratricopeptide repeat protein n=1 Tax=Massilia sp. W12 TaxID=3126507 RepID=UPI0030CBE0C0